MSLLSVIYYIILLATPVAVGLNEVNELKRWEWHQSQVWERLALIAFGVSVALSAYGDWLLLTARILILAPVFWIIYDEILDYYGFDGKHSTSVLNKYTDYKAPLLGVLLAFLIFAEVR